MQKIFRYGLYEQALSILKNPSKKITPHEIEDINGDTTYERSKEQKEASTGPLTEEAGKAYACYQVLESALSIPNCVRGIEAARTIMGQRGDWTLVLLAREVLTNPKYQEGLRLAALKIMGHVDSGKTPKGSLFQDIENSFINAGISKEEANDLTWNTMAVISTGGASMGLHLLPFGDKKSAQQVKTSLAFIAGSMGILNLRTHKSGKPYSYPSNLISHCDNGKPYHFWMAAYLSREVAKKIDNSDDAAAAVFSASKGYQFIARTGPRRPERALEVDTFDGFNNVIRMDLTYMAAGTKYGIDSLVKKSSEINIDQGIQKIVQESKIAPNIPSSKVAREMNIKNLNSGKQTKNIKSSDDLFLGTNIKEAYELWSERFAPDTPFFLFHGRKSKK